MLEAELRRRVRAQLDIPMLDWLESAARHHKESRHGALVDGALALSAADDALARGDNEHAVALLERHAAALGDVAHASELAAEAHRRIAVRRRATTATRIDQARLVLAAGDLEGCERACAELDRRDLDGAQRQRLDASFVIDDERIEKVFVVPGGSYLWLEAMAPRGEPVTRVIEIDAWRLRRELPRSRNLEPLVAGSASCVIGSAHDGGALRYAERGTVLEELSACTGVHVSAVTSAPDGGLVVLGHRSPEVDELEIARVKDGRIVHRGVLPESMYERAHRCATAGAARLIVVHHVVEVGDARLVALRIGDPGLAPVYTVVAPSDLVLAQNVDATEVVGIWDTGSGVKLARVSAEPPAFDDVHGSRAQWSLPALAGYFPCGPYEADEADGGRLYAANEAARRGQWPTSGTIGSGSCSRVRQAST
jgi:hypothetical protein